MTENVLIIGAGPTGLTLAIELARYGVPVRIVEKATHRTDKSKALVLWSRTLELLDHQPGGSEPFLEVGIQGQCGELRRWGETDRACQHGLNRDALSLCLDDPAIGN